MEAGGFLRHGRSVRKYGLSLIFRLNKRLEERIWTDFPTANLPDPRKFTGVIWVKEEVCGRRNARVVGKISFLLSLLPRLSLSLANKVSRVLMGAL